jgi:opacity protein-like surface antigen
MLKLKLNRYAVILILLGFLTLTSGKSVAQSARVEITPFGGYLLGGSVKFYEGKFKIENAASYGAMLAVKARGGNFVELSYTRMDSKGYWEPYYNYIIDLPADTFDIAMNYLQINSLNEFNLDNESIKPYGTAGMGASWIHPKEGDANDEWMFTFNAALGLKYFFSDRIGIRLQARMILPMIFNGGGFYFGYGSGGAYVSSTTTMVQGDFTGGLIVVLGN